MSLLARVPGSQADLVKRTVTDQIADKMAYMIVSGLLQPGDELPSERTLAETLHVSRETVRRAIASLAGRGMVEVSQGARTRVVGARGQTLAGGVGVLAALADKPVDEVAEARACVELQVVQMAAERIDEASLARLRALLAEQRAMVDDPVAFQISDREFHSIVYGACGNPLLRDFVCDLYDYALDYRRQALQREGAIARSVRDHEKVLEALARHDAAAARRAIGMHLDHVYATTVQEMRGRTRPRATRFR
jgi:DNA-binding FadR family transcriptional regulator